MIVSESYAVSPARIWAVAPAPAREILRANSESLATDTVYNSAMSGGAEREARVTELRKLYQDGNYQVNADDVSAGIIEAHLQT